MKLLLKYLKIQFMAQMAYRTSFFLLSLGQFFVPFLIFVSMVLLFQRFEQLMGWTLHEVALVYSVIHMAFSTSEFIGRGFDMFSHMIRKGEFDRLLVRPRSTILQVLGSKFEFTRIGRFTQSIIVMVYAVANIDKVWGISDILLLLFMIIGGTIMFVGIYMLGATLTFFTVEGIEVINVLTDGGREMAQYPLGIYQEWAKKFFSFVIPFGAVNYYPMLYLLDKSDNPLYPWLPLYAAAFIIPCTFIWKFGVKHYKSTGS